MDILEKQLDIINKLNKKEEEYILKYNEYKMKKCKLLLETDFTEVLNKSRPTVDEKNAFVDLNTLDLKQEKDLLYNEVKYLKMLLDLNHDEIKLKEVGK